jgi:hypothetical protein
MMSIISHGLKVVLQLFQKYLSSVLVRIPSCTIGFGYLYGLLRHEIVATKTLSKTVLPTERGDVLTDMFRLRAGMLRQHVTCIIVFLFIPNN